MSDRYVVATAGHVDHGKSTLVRALTGMEPDRFAEERRRGMTIDLGFAWTTLPSGAHLAFVDVPGHERFIGNMLAGLGPAPAVLFVVAADGGWSAQSSEHLAAADALGVCHGLLAITRSDLAEAEPVRRDALERITRTSLGRVDSVVVSGTTGAGLPALRTALDRLVAALPVRDANEQVRLWVDRSFSVRGAGTVVTGTLTGGTVRVGDTLEHDGTRVTVRRLQSAGRDHESLGGTARVALNLRGIPVGAIERGSTLLTPDAWHRTREVDVRAAAGGLPAHCLLHVGSAAVPVHVRPLGDAHARLGLDRALALRAGDRAVLRDPGRRDGTIVGVVVLDADPPPFARRGAAQARARDLAGRSPVPDALVELARHGSVLRSRLERLGVDTTALPDVGGWLIDDAVRADVVRRAPGVVRTWAQAHPLDPAMPSAAFTRELHLPDAATLAASIAGAAELVVRDGRVSGPGGPGDLGAAQAGIDTLVARLKDHPFRAPRADDLAELGLGRRELAAAVRAGALIRLDDVVLLPDAVDTAVTVLRGLPAPFTLGEARQALDTTRRVAVPLLEHLDAQGRTTFVDATRRVVAPVLDPGTA